MKLVDKWREGSRWVRRHDRPQTAYQRLMSHPKLSGKARRQLRDRVESLDPFVLAAEVERRLQPILGRALAEQGGRVVPPADPSCRLLLPGRTASPGEDRDRKAMSR